MYVTPRKILRIGVTLVAVAAAMFVVWYFARVVAYIIISAVLAVIGRPMVSRLSEMRFRGQRMPRAVAAGTTLLLMWTVIGGLCALLLPLVFSKLDELSRLDLDSVIKSIEIPIQRLQLHLQKFFALSASEIDLSFKDFIAEHINFDFLRTFASVARSIFDAFISVFSITFITFFFMKEDGLFYSLVTLFFPERYKQNATRALDSVTRLLSRYFRGLMLESIMLLGVISIVMAIWGVELDDALFIGMIMGVMNVIPYAGPFMGGIASVCVGIVTPIAGMSVGDTVAIIIGSLIFIKILDDFVLQPTLYSERVQAHPLEIFLVILIAGSMAGIWGMLLAIPSYTVLQTTDEMLERRNETLNMEIEIEAEVIHGRKLGRRMGFPTANMQTDDIEGVSRGVYRSSVEIDGHTYTAMSNLGVRPSVGGESLLLETHVIGYEGDLYGRRLRVRLLEKIRDERRFGSIDELQRQLQADYMSIKEHAQ